VSATQSNRLRDEDPITWDEEISITFPSSVVRVLTQ